MLKGVKAVLFDLDGTLVDSMWMWKDIDVEYLEDTGGRCRRSFKRRSRA